MKSASQLNSQQKTPGPLVAGDAYRIRRITGPIKTFHPETLISFWLRFVFQLINLLPKSTKPQLTFLYEIPEMEKMQL